MINELEVLFRKIILKLRYHKRKYALVNQFCKCCGTEMGYDYHVSDSDWSKLPLEYHNHVLCIHCFCKLHPDLESVDFKFYK